MSTKALTMIAIGISTALVALSAVAWTPAAASPSQQSLATATPLPTTTPKAAKTPPATPRATQRKLPNLAARLKAHGLVTGLVTAKDGNILTLQRGKVTTQVTSTMDTLVLIPGVPKAHVADIQVGDHVAALAPNSAAGGSATLIVDLPRSYTRSNIVAGTVQKVNQGAFSILVGGNVHQVRTDSSAQVMSVAGLEPSVKALADIQRGSIALVVGQKNGAGIQAQFIILLDKSALPGGNKKTPVPTPTPRPI